MLKADKINLGCSSWWRNIFRVMDGLLARGAGEELAVLGAGACKICNLPRAGMNTGNADLPFGENFNIPKSEGVLPFIVLMKKLLLLGFFFFLVYLFADLLRFSSGLAFARVEVFEELEKVSAEKRAGSESAEKSDNKADAEKPLGGGLPVSYKPVYHLVFVPFLLGLALGFLFSKLVHLLCDSSNSKPENGKER
jgi:hypothetical protein